MIKKILKTLLLVMLFGGLVSTVITYALAWVNAPSEDDFYSITAVDIEKNTVQITKDGLNFECYLTGIRLKEGVDVEKYLGIKVCPEYKNSLKDFEGVFRGFLITEDDTVLQIKMRQNGDADRDENYPVTASYHREIRDCV